VLAADAPGLPEPPLPNETFCADGLPVRRPSVLADVEFTSTLRPYRILLRTAIVVPWSDAYSDGMVVVGCTGVQPRLPEPAADLVRRLRIDVRRSMSSGRRHGATEINGELQRAMKAIAVATVDCEDVGESLTTLLVSAQWLFDSEVAYPATPPEVNLPQPVPGYVESLGTEGVVGVLRVDVRDTPSVDHDLDRPGQPGKRVYRPVGSAPLRRHAVASSLVAHYA